MLNKKKIKKEFARKKMKIGQKAILKFDRLQEKFILREIEKAIRNAKISGRKVVKEEDFESES